MVEETPLLETLKTRWSKAPENIHAGSILHWAKAKGPVQLVFWISSLAVLWKIKTYISLDFSLFFAPLCGPTAFCVDLY